jgi:hypothetical protein
VIIGHEVAHALAHHGAERASQVTLLGIIGTGASIALGGAVSRRAQPSAAGARRAHALIAALRRDPARRRGSSTM